MNIPALHHSVLHILMYVRMYYAAALAWGGVRARGCPRVMDALGEQVNLLLM